VPHAATGDAAVTAFAAGRVHDAQVRATLRARPWYARQVAHLGSGAAPRFAI